MSIRVQAGVALFRDTVQVMNLVVFTDAKELQAPFLRLKEICLQGVEAAAEEDIEPLTIGLESVPQKRQTVRSCIHLGTILWFNSRFLSLLISVSSIAFSRKLNVLCFK